MADKLAKAVKKGLDDYFKQKKPKAGALKPKVAVDPKKRLAAKKETKSYGTRFRKTGGSTKNRRGYTPSGMVNHENYNDSVKRKYGGGKI